MYYAKIDYRFSDGSQGASYSKSAPDVSILCEKVRLVTGATPASMATYLPKMSKFDASEYDTADDTDGHWQIEFWVG